MQATWFAILLNDFAFAPPVLFVCVDRKASPRVTSSVTTQSAHIPYLPATGALSDVRKGRMRSLCIAQYMLS